MGGPTSPYTCTLNVNGYFTGVDGTASAMGWQGNHNGVVACLGGSFFVENGVFKSYGFGIYTGTRTSWTNADGYLPALVTSFPHDGALVSITEFGDRVVLAGDAYVLLYARVAVTNPTGRRIAAAPEPSPELVPLNTAPDDVAPHGHAVHDYVVAVDRFGQDYPWPTAAQMASAGSFTQHFAHMRAFWNGQLAQIAAISVPNPQLVDAYKSGFIYTQIAREGNDLDDGVNGYEGEYSHDVVGILANLFTQGYFTGAADLLLEARSVVAQAEQFAQVGQYVDGLWTYPWPWAVYLLKTGDLELVKANFATEGPGSPPQPSIEDAAHAIAADRTGPGGIMEVTNDIDTNGYWTIDDFEALMGLAAYRYIAMRVGDTSEVQWATGEYDSLLTATNQTLESTIAKFDLDYIPCSILQPNTANRCANPEDANWAAPFDSGRWAWDAPLFGAPVYGPGLSLIDATYAYGFGRLRGKLPPDTFGGYPDDWYSTGYNAGYGGWGLAGRRFRDQGILSYEFMIDRTQSGPYSWWESVSPPAASPWVGSHPASGQGSSPHAWGMANANKVLLDSLVAARSDGSVVVGRGVPDAWLARTGSYIVARFPTTDGHRLGLKVTWHGQTVTLALSGQRPSGGVLFQLPAFLGNVASASSGRVDSATGTVTLRPGTAGVTVHLAHAVAA
ncbi:MAG TPA: hypothetical protein VK277_09775 [Acidimicrobiales bacterium]|nr:hypothetical protein [Acidimicrobiales bacterium]